MIQLEQVLKIMGFSDEYIKEIVDSDEYDLNDMQFEDMPNMSQQKDEVTSQYIYKSDNNEL